jgi:DNA-binding transcriptional MerR regulator
MSSLMKIGELTKQTGLSIRTLHYYDEIGLLSPSHRTEVGHRLYSDQDIIRLQQILSLRQLGFSLKEIIECLETPEFALPKVIDLHRTRVREQMALSRTLLGRLNAIATELETTQSIAVEQLIQAMETITMSEQYFTPEQQAVLEARFQQEETQWQELLNQAQAEMSKGTELNSHSAYKLARRWQLIMKSLIRGDEQLYESLVRMYQQEGVEAASLIQMDAATFEYILKALAFLSIADDMGLVISDKCFTADAKQVICLGDEAVRQFNLYVLGTEAILLGLLVEGKSVAAQVLTAAGVTFAAVQDQIVKLLGRATLPEEAYIPAQLPYAPRVKRVLELALEKASQLGQSSMTPEHILLGILKEAEETGGGVATHVLKEGFGIDLAHLEQQLRSAMSQ